MPRTLRFVARRHVALRVVVGRADDVAAGAIAVVEHVLGAAVAIGVEHLADMREAVPLRRVLQRQEHLVVADDVGGGGIVAAQRVVHVGLVAAHGGLQHRRMAARREDGAARIVERQRQAERLADLHLGDALQDLLRRQEIEPAAFIVGAEIAPGRAGGAVGPAWIVCHDEFPPVCIAKPKMAANCGDCLMLPIAEHLRSTDPRARASAVPARLPGASTARSACGRPAALRRCLPVIAPRCVRRFRATTSWFPD